MAFHFQFVKQLPIKINEMSYLPCLRLVIDWQTPEAFLKDPYCLNFLARAKMPIIPSLVVYG
jgi:hypothetical protein